MKLSVLGVHCLTEMSDSEMHTHKTGQLLFISEGSARIVTKNLQCLIPPRRVAWIPPNVSHMTRSQGVIGYRSIYFDTSLIAVPLEDRPLVLQPGRLLWEILESISEAELDVDWRLGRHKNLLALCLDELGESHREPLLLPIPTDRRLQKLKLDKLPPKLDELAQKVGASEKTISRIFRKETSMSYNNGDSIGVY